MTTPAARSDRFLNSEEARKLAEQHAKFVAEAEVKAAQSSMKELFPSDTPVSIQLLQPVEGGRLVDVGPRPPGISSDLISQSTQSGVTGRLVLERQFLDHFFPSDDAIGEQEKGAFSQALISLEGARYPGTGRWKREAPPADSRIHQVPLLPLPLTMQPRRAGAPYRFADLGVTYTVTAANLTSKQETQVKRLSLYALRAGEIVQHVRYQAICGGSNCTTNPTECRLLVTRVFPEASRWDKEYDDEHDQQTSVVIEDAWRDNVDGGMCRLAGTLILHHHWWFPYDPIAFQILEELSGNASNAEAIYWSHLCVPPAQNNSKNSSDENRSRPLSELIKILCEDLEYIIGSYKKRLLSEGQRLRISQVVNAMLLQFTGSTERRYAPKQAEFARLSRSTSRTSGAQTLGILTSSESWKKEITDLFNPAKACLCSDAMARKAQAHVLPSVITESMMKDPDYERCQFIFGMLAPSQHPLRVMTLDRSGTGLVSVQCENHDDVLWRDRNGKVQHFLYWHTRAMHAWNKSRDGKSHGSASN